MGVYRALLAVSEGMCVASSRATYTTEQMFLEVERDVCVLLDDLQDLNWSQRVCIPPFCVLSYLDALCNDLIVMRERCIRKARTKLLPQVQLRHLDAISWMQKGN